MANFTGRAIREAFLRLLNDRAMSRITVKDIAEECGISRNCFYYHYSDIPALLEEMVREECDRIIRAYPTLDSLEQCMQVAIEFALENRGAALNIYHSVGRDMFEHYLWQTCGDVISNYFGTIFRGKRISASDQAIIIHYYKCECFGEVIAWMEDDMKDDIIANFHRLCELRRGQLEEMIRRCEEQSAT